MAAGIMVIVTLFSLQPVVTMSLLCSSSIPVLCFQAILIGAYLWPVSNGQLYLAHLNSFVRFTKGSHSDPMTLFGYFAILIYRTQNLPNPLDLDI